MYNYITCQVLQEYLETMHESIVVCTWKLGCPDVLKRLAHRREGIQEASHLEGKHTWGRGKMHQSLSRL